MACITSGFFIFAQRGPGERELERAAIDALVRLHREFYFHFASPFYAISRFTFVALDTASLLRTALASDYDWLKASGFVQGLARAAHLLLETLTNNFVDAKVQPVPPDAGQRAAWRTRYDHAMRKFRDAGIAVRPDVDRGADEYVAARTDWECFSRRLASFMAYSIQAIDRVTPMPQRGSIP